MAELLLQGFQKRLSRSPSQQKRHLITGSCSGACHQPNTTLVSRMISALVASSSLLASLIRLGLPCSSPEWCLTQIWRAMPSHSAQLSALQGMLPRSLRLF